jgi:hypothetical protein
MEATPYHVPYVDAFSAFNYCGVLVFDEGALRGLVYCFMYNHKRENEELAFHLDAEKTHRRTDVLL